ncbi:hypothetical protein GCM10027447_29540 [Glycomyces halotolerans]
MTYYEGIDFGSLPNTYGDIRDKINDLHPAFVEIYQREHALEAWPDYAFIIKLSLDEARDRSNGNNNSILGNTSPRDMQHPSRNPYILPFRVPQESTQADEEVIDGAAKSDADTAIEEVNSAFREVLDDGSLSGIDSLLRQAASAAEKIDSLIDAHENGGFKQIRELFEAWEGKDSDAGMEKYGNRLRPAAGIHRVIASGLLAGAAAECAAKLTAQLQLGAALDKVHGQIEELKTGSSPSLTISVRTAFNAIPHSGVLVSLGDGIAEVIGQDDSAVSDWVNGFFEALELEYEMGLTPQQGSKLKSELLETASSTREQLRSARDEAKGNLETDHGTWEGLYRSDPQVLIPGEKDLWPLPRSAPSDRSRPPPVRPSSWRSAPVPVRKETPPRPSRPIPGPPTTPSRPTRAPRSTRTTSNRCSARSNRPVPTTATKARRYRSQATPIATSGTTTAPTRPGCTSPSNCSETPPAPPPNRTRITNSDTGGPTPATMPTASWNPCRSRSPYRLSPHGSPRRHCTSPASATTA